MPLETFIPFAIFAFVASITPGPNNIMLLASGVNFGVRATVPHMLGINTGFFALLLAAGFGLGEVFKTYPDFYAFMKWVSVIYFFYLAAMIVRSSTPSSDTKSGSKARPLNYLEAALFQWINPKAVLMAIGGFSSYAPPGSNARFVILLSVLFAAINAPCIALWAVFGARLREHLQNPSYRMIFNWVMAILLIASLLPILFTAHSLS